MWNGFVVCVNDVVFYYYELFAMCLNTFELCGKDLCTTYLKICEQDAEVHLISYKNKRMLNVNHLNLIIWHWKNIVKILSFTLVL